MRLKHDLIFAREVPGVDLVLGGHDHEYHMESIEHKLKDESSGPGVKNKVVPLVKSGTDFRDFTEIELTFGLEKDAFKLI